jgi:hypothetical protein
MSTDTMQQSARTPTPAPDVIDLTNDSDTSTPLAASRRASVERRTQRARHSEGRREGPFGYRVQQDHSRRDGQRWPDTIIDLEASNFASMPPYEPDQSVNEDEFLGLFQETPSSPGFEITGERLVRDDQQARSVAGRRPTPFNAREEREPSEVPQLPPPLFQNLPHGLATWIARAGARVTGGDVGGRTVPDRPRETAPVNRYPYSGLFAPIADLRLANAQRLQLLRPDEWEAPRLNYEAQGFQLLGGTARSSPPPRLTSPYKAPRVPAPGFIRKVDEEDIVVCPHCGDELGMGDDEVKQQIWVVKQCGHVSCAHLLPVRALLTTLRSTVVNVPRIAALVRPRKSHPVLRANQNLSRCVWCRAARNPSLPRRHFSQFICDRG